MGYTIHGMIIWYSPFSFYCMISVECGPLRLKLV